MCQQPINSIPPAEQVLAQLSEKLREVDLLRRLLRLAKKAEENTKKKTQAAK